ncbi:hypothetical protein LWI29_011833 [Acer saccharum]|uniref:Reverse transcriptase domain-containing protein n=1 Tax=Acer saccharum TaxID=4024 RepID=A0AA39UHS1_ACESA|nr:hypothetical protein LWI29_011833 [Acer saccharum]
MKNYHKSGGSTRCTMKVDLMKAYDSVDWDFALHSLCCFGMPGKFVSWVWECITSPRISVAVNGTLVGYFEGKRGFKQGDLLSPYLFVSSMEVLSSLLAECVVKNEGFGYHHRCSKVISAIVSIAFLVFRIMASPPMLGLVEVPMSLEATLVSSPHKTYICGKGMVSSSSGRHSMGNVLPSIPALGENTVAIGGPSSIVVSLIPIPLPDVPNVQQVYSLLPCGASPPPSIVFEVQIDSSAIMKVFSGSEKTSLKASNILSSLEIVAFSPSELEAVEVSSSNSNLVKTIDATKASNMISINMNDDASMRQHTSPIILHNSMKVAQRKRGCGPVIENEA